MDLQWYLALLLFCILHIVLALMLLQDLARRNKVLGGHKAPWAILIIFITFIGSLLYLVCHPQIFYGEE
ncbi:MAG TPA: PLDc N-terminal domain-containing protein [Dehalococcoidales bacterium]|nr:PLDc N-terminal domain-containing protein [Dehalococcoidales bacterium]